MKLDSSNFWKTLLQFKFILMVFVTLLCFYYRAKNFTLTSTDFRTQKSVFLETAKNSFTCFYSLYSSHELLSSLLRQMGKTSFEGTHIFSKIKYGVKNSTYLPLGIPRCAILNKLTLTELEYKGVYEIAYQCKWSEKNYQNGYFLCITQIFSVMEHNQLLALIDNPNLQR